MTDHVIEFALDREPGAQPQEAIDASRRLVMDTLACVVGGLATRPGQAVAGLKRRQGGRAEATLIGCAQGVPVGSAAYAHAHAGNILDADETLHHKTHFAVAVVMPALAIAERCGRSGAELLAAVAVGYDVAARVGMSLSRYDTTTTVIKKSPLGGFTWAALGTAVACGRLLGLDAAAMQDAIGAAYVSTPVGLVAEQAIAPMLNDDRAYWHKYAMYGALAEAGVNGALLAEVGFKAQARLLDAGSTFGRSFGAPDYDAGQLTAGLGHRWYVTETSFKPYPSCRTGHVLLDLFADIVHEHDLHADDIDAVEVIVPPYRIAEVLAASSWPSEQYKAMMSIPHSLWMILQRIPGGPLWWSGEHLDDAAGQRFADRVTGVVDDSYKDHLLDQIREDGAFFSFPCRVTVRGRKGAWTLSGEYASGDPWSAQSRWSDARLDQKIRDFAAPVFGADGAADLVAAGHRLATAEDLSELTAPLRRAPIAAVE